MIPAAIEMKSFPFVAAFAEISRKLRHHLVDCLRLDGEQDCARLAHDFEYCRRWWRL